MTDAPRTAHCLLAALALVIPILTVNTAAASPRQYVEYDALGDSYASGYGVPPYDGACGRSDSAYAVQLDGRMRIELDDFVACAGATTGSLVAGGQLDALDEDTDLVTISIGGNDIGWSSAVGACLGRTDELCTGALNATAASVTAVLPGLLDSLYSQLSARAPGAHVVVTGYPRLFSPEYGPYLSASVTEQEQLNDGADLLNTVLAKAAGDHGFQFVDVTKRFLSHGVNAPEPWILGPTDPGRFHPNADGYETYTAAVTTVVRPSRLP